MGMIESESEVDAVESFRLSYLCSDEPSGDSNVYRLSDTKSNDYSAIFSPSGIQQELSWHSGITDSVDIWVTLPQPMLVRIYQPSDIALQIGISVGKTQIYFNTQVYLETPSEN